MSDQRERRDPRYPVTWAVSIRAADWLEVQQLSTENVSRGGLFIRTRSQAAPGTRLQIELTLPDGTVFPADGEVIHCIAAERARAEGVAAGIGVRFDARHAVDLYLLETAAAGQAGGLAHAYAFDPLGFATLEATLAPVGQPGETAEPEWTTAHHLIEPPATTVGLDDSPLAAVAASVPELAASASELAVAKAEPCVFGIDFGTTYSSIAVVLGERVVVLEDADGNTLTPSVVCYPEEGPPLVGWPARERIATHPTTTLSSIKRLVGRRYDDPALEAFWASSPLRGSAGVEGETLLDIYGQPISTTQVASEVLRRLREIGERATGLPVERVLLSAPLGAPAQRAAIQRAAELAGLQVLGVVDEPVAAAMSYAVGRDEEQLIAVYDFGGGTFDFSLLRLADARLSVLSQAGDAWLGGDDFDTALAQHAAAEFWQRWHVDLRQRQVEWQRLLFLAEVAKRRLSLQPSVELKARAIALSVRGPIDLVTTFDRALFEQLCGELVGCSLEIVEGCLREAGVSPAQVDRVVLTGGVSRMPLVRERLQRYFARELPLLVDPEQAIVIGDAIYGRFLELAQRGSGLHRGVSSPGTPVGGPPGE
ncbi:MAG: Hsp70 family protein [Proteobacteria bacterium]|nr:Hsp70 family protein [Pseudomonadota bacterium]